MNTPASKVDYTNVQNMFFFIWELYWLEVPDPENFWSTRNSNYSAVPYTKAITTAQPDDKWLWFREFRDVLPESLIKRFVKIIKARKDNPDELRATIKGIFWYLWQQMWTWLSHSQISWIVNSLNSFESPYVVPVERVSWNIFLSNQSTGPTSAFKDLALQMLTVMVAETIKLHNIQSIQNAKKWIRGQKLKFVITQTSTSGDTGPAWWKGIENKDFIVNIIGFPATESTYGQAWQMLNLKNNVMSIPMTQAFTAIQNSMKEWNTPEYRAWLKSILEKEFADLIEQYWFEIEIEAWSFNSVNIGRIDGQSIYHMVTSFITQAQSDIKTVNEVIPSGNFGHVYGTLQAKMMWANINKIVVSTNENDAIYRLIKYGKYKMAEDEISCPSVSMIIRYWSNVERLLRVVCGDERTKKLMEKFNAWEEIELTSQEFKYMTQDLWLVSYKVSIEDELMTMREVWLMHNRLICPHTANAYFSAQQFAKDYPDIAEKEAILASETASPWKFLAATVAALTCKTKEEMKQKYFELREIECNISTDLDTIRWFIDMIKDAYVANWREFDESIIPANLREIYDNWFKDLEIKDASEFADITTEFVRSYAWTFRKQVENLIDTIDVK